jgi:glutamyl-tRNA synthetase
LFEMSEVRVRFAPSPTGALHIGGVRTALYNYLLARKLKGTMILRIEDTDQGRFVPGAEDYIMESLAWAGIQIDEGVREGGPHAPYRQSERKQIYQQYAQRLVDEGNAYYAFDTSDELDFLRKESPSFQYDSTSRARLRNSLSMSASEVRQRISSGSTYVIRIKIPAGIEIKLNDLIRGEVVVQSSQVDDKVLMKSDGMPTYHLANVVDDYLMKISHVIRGEEWLPSAPLHVMLYKFLGWETSMPKFAHLPLLLKPDGNGKLSKRDADKMGFPIFPLNWKDQNSGEISKGYRESGYLPEALINFLAFLGWNPGTEKEIFSMDELVDAFSLDRIVKSGARFDIHKAQWYNQQYLKARPVDELVSFLQLSLSEAGLPPASSVKAAKVVHAMRDRITFPHDIFDKASFFFRKPAAYDVELLAKKMNDQAGAALSAYAEQLAVTDSVSAEKAKNILEIVTSGLGMKPGQVLQVLRIALTGDAAGPDLMLTIEILGGNESASRIRQIVASRAGKVA